MTPPVKGFPASELQDRVQLDMQGRRRKHDAGTASRVDLERCELFEMLQYKCNVEKPESPDSAVKCYAWDRLFRRCKDRKGTFTVETTAWERDPNESRTQGNNDKSQKDFIQWSSSWNNADSPSPSP